MKLIDVEVEITKDPPVNDYKELGWTYAPVQAYIVVHVFFSFFFIQKELKFVYELREDKKSGS